MPRTIASEAERSKSRVRICACCLVGVVWLIGLAAELKAQAQQNTNPFGNRLQMQSDGTNAFLPAPREILRPLIRAEKAIEAKKYSDAIGLLGEILSDEEIEDYLVVLPSMADKSPNVAVSLRSHAESVLGKIPASERKSYETRFGIRAEQQLNAAIQSSDLERLSQVVKRFFYTQAGYKSAMILGHHYLEQGQIISAASSFRRIVETPDAREQYEPEASVLLATCLILSEEPAEAEDVLRSLKQRRPDGKLKFNNQQFAIFEDDQSPLDWLRGLVGESPLTANRMVNQWVMHGGNPQRLAQSGTGFPLSNPRWKIPTLNDIDLEKVAIKVQGELLLEKTTTIPSMQPLAIGDTIVMRTNKEMIGVDFKTGRRIWVFPPPPSSEFFASSDAWAADEMELETKMLSSNWRPLVERLWKDSHYGQASSDGKRIFVVPRAGTTANVAPRAFGRATLNRSRVQINNRLFAVDVEQQGAFVWEVGGESGMDEPKLAGAYFLGAPLPLDGSLYAVVLVRAEVKVVELNPSTGAMIWQQQLATVDSGINPATNPLLKFSAASPSFASGVLVCPTGLGALVGLDLTTRSLKWGYQYKTPNSRFNPNARGDQYQLSSAWRDSTVMISDGKILFTPTDSPGLYCLDLHSGKNLWKSGVLAREDSLFIATIHDGKIILAGKEKVRAIDLRTGKHQWRLPTEDYGPPSGHGYANREHYYLPTTEKKILKINLKDGLVEKAVSTRDLLGNLICYQGNVISHSALELSSYLQDEPSWLLMERAIEAGKAEGYALKAQLLMHEEDYEGATAAIAKAYKLEPSPQYEEMLLDLVIKTTKVDFESGMKLAEELEALILSKRKIEYLSALVDGLIENERYEEAAEAMLLIVEPAEQFLLERESFLKFDAEVASDPEELDQGVMLIRADSWFYSRAASLLSTEARPVLVKRANEILIESKELTAKKAFELFQLFPVDAFEADKLLGLADRLRNENEELRSLAILEQLAEKRGEEQESLVVRAKATAALAEINSKSRFREFADPYLEQLANEFADVLLTDDIVGKTFAANLRADSEVPEKGRWKDGVVIGSTRAGANTARAQMFVNNTKNVIDVQQSDHQIYRTFKVRMRGTTHELFFDDGYGSEVAKFKGYNKTRPNLIANRSQQRGEIRYRNHLGMVNLGNTMVAIDCLKMMRGEDPVLWNFSSTLSRNRGLPPGVRMWGVEKSLGQNGYAVQVCGGGSAGMCYLDRNQLICVDSFTGERRWNRACGAEGARLLGDHQHAVVSREDAREALVYDIRTGELIRRVSLDESIGDFWRSVGSKALVSEIKVEENKANPIEGLPKSGLGRMQTMALVDFVKGEKVWERKFALNTRANLIEDRFVAIKPPESPMQILDLQTGETVQTIGVELPRADKSQKLVNFDVLPNGPRLIFRFQFRQSNRRQSVKIKGKLPFDLAPFQYNEPFWDGCLLAVDRKSFKPVWNRPVRIEHFQYLKGHPVHSPICWLGRRITQRSLNRSDMKYWNQYVAVDLRNGQMVMKHRTPYSSTVGDIPIKVDLEQQQCELKLHDRTFVCKFTDEPSSPRAVAHLTNENSVTFVELATAEEKKSDDVSKWDEMREQTKEMLRQKQAELRKKQAVEKEELKKEENAPIKSGGK